MVNALLNAEKAKKSEELFESNRIGMTTQKYNHIEVEKKWQQYWEEKKLFKAEVNSSKPKYYVLDMFPYPSGAGLHVGHVTGYTATDVMARYKRQQGYNVLHPMGWDSFGLQAEQYAVRTGQHPRITTEKNINTYRRQLKALGFSYDWDREVTTSKPDYYKWTQWIFTKLYEKGLAYEEEVLVNYCPHLGTVLANEEVENGHSKEGGYPVERKPLKQWVLKITAYAEKLLDDLDDLDWPEYLKKLQRNWIGKSEGARIDFSLEDGSESIQVFTTRADTLFGATYLAIAPEHPLVKKLTTEKNKRAVKDYLKKASHKSDLERTELAKDKTGVPTGSYAINPVNGEKLPIWIADYILMGYGTGAIMAVPAHDERDFEFAKKFDLPIRFVINPPEDFDRNKSAYTGNGKLINSQNDSLSINGLKVEQAKEKVIAFLKEKKMGEKTTTYKLRDWLFSRQRYWGEPFPILHLEDGSKRLLELDELPLIPPDLDDYKPSGDGLSPLAKAKDWIEITDPKTGKKARRETNTMPQWAGSCWYYLRFCDPNNELAAWGKEEENYWMPVDLYVGGVEHAVLHLLYARFWHKVLFDCGLVSTKEPFASLRNQGLVTAKSYKIPGGEYVAPEHADEYDNLVVQVEKMSKSKLNGVSPDEMIEEHGADSLRLYELFMSPFDKEKLWNSDAVHGCRRFLDRFYLLAHSEKLCEEEKEEGMKLAHRLVHGVRQDIEQMLFNTAIAKMMEFLNHFTSLKSYPKKAVKMAVQVLYPFAPHISEEMWSLLGEKESLTYKEFPEVDPSFLEDKTTTYVVQVNGKLRGKLDLPKDQNKEEIVDLAKKEPNVSKYLGGTILKIIFVPNKLLNFVMKP